MSGNDFLNKNVLRWRWKIDRDVAEVISSGSWFHVWGSELENARLPIVDRSVCNWPRCLSLVSRRIYDVIITHLAIGTTKDCRIVAVGAPGLQLAEAEVDVRSVALAGAWSRPHGDATQRWKHHTRREPENGGRVAFDRLLQHAAADLLVLIHTYIHTYIRRVRNDSTTHSLNGWAGCLATVRI